MILLKWKYYRTKPLQVNIIQNAKRILDGLGGKNIISLNHCATRLRLELKDNSIIDEQKIKKCWSYWYNSKWTPLYPSDYWNTRTTSCQ